MGQFPCRSRLQRRGINRTTSNRDRRKDQATKGAISPGMQSETYAPCDQHNGNGPTALPHDHEKRCGNGCSGATQPVLHGRIGRHHPVRIFGRVAPDHCPRQNTNDDEGDPDQLFAAPLKRRLHVRVKQRVTSYLISHS